MSKREIVAFLPCRAGSERVRNKNTRPFDRDGSSLLERKLKQLHPVKEISKVVVSTNDPVVDNLVLKFNDPKMVVDNRPLELCQSTTSLGSLIEYTGQLLDGVDILWTHTTSPFLGTSFYSKAIEKFRHLDKEGYDSLVTVRKEQDFFVFEDSPLNFGASQEFWPRTQDLEPLYRLTSGIFLLSSQTMRERKNRIGKVPFFLETSLMESLDLDSEEEFCLGQILAVHEGKSGLGHPTN